MKIVAVIVVIIVACVFIAWITGNIPSGKRFTIQVGSEIFFANSYSWSDNTTLILRDGCDGTIIGCVVGLDTFDEKMILNAVNVQIYE